MALTLTKKDIEDEDEHFWMVTSKYTDGEEIPESYTFELAKTESYMEAIIVPDLTAKGYADLSPVTWVTE